MTMKKFILPIFATALLVSCGGSNGGGNTPANLRDETKEVSQFYKTLTGKDIL